MFASDSLFSSPELRFRGCGMRVFTSLYFRSKIFASLQKL
jgi:hypothetical protein